MRCHPQHSIGEIPQAWIQAWEYAKAGTHEALLLYGGVVGFDESNVLSFVTHEDEQEVFNDGRLLHLW